VAFYMRQAFRKLNISSRVELTRIVMQQSQQPATVNPMQGIAPQPPSPATRRSLSSKSLLPGNSAVARLGTSRTCSRSLDSRRSGY
jgi:hypothetical protein